MLRTVEPISPASRSRATVSPSPATEEPENPSRYFEERHGFAGARRASGAWGPFRGHAINRNGGDSMSYAFSGSLVAMVTPFRNGEVDEAKVRELVEFH